MSVSRIGQILLGATWLGLAAPWPAAAGAFAVFDQSAAATGMGGAATALDDDASSLYYNVGAAAFLKEPSYAFGAVLRAAQSLSFDMATSVDEFGTSFDQESPSPVLPHGFVVQPVAQRLNLGIAVYTPFDHDIDHGSTDFPGRNTALSSSIRSVDASFNLAWRVHRRYGVGVGAVARVSTFSLLRHLPTALTPSEVVDFASLDLESDPQVGIGFNAGLLFKPSSKFSVGLSYRSKIEIDYTGSGTLAQLATGNVALDDALAASLPFDQDLPMATTLEFPDTASVGIALKPSKRLTLSGDINWTGWSSVDTIPLRIDTLDNFSNPIALGLDDTLTLRAGIEFATRRDTRFRFGFAFDESPQREADLSAFLLDSDRNILTAGLGKDWLQVAVQWINHEGRSGPMANPGDQALDGTFGGDEIRLLVTLKKKQDIQELVPPAVQKDLDAAKQQADAVKSALGGGQ